MYFYVEPLLDPQCLCHEVTAAVMAAGCKVTLINTCCVESETYKYGSYLPGTLDTAIQRDTVFQTDTVTR